MQVLFLSPRRCWPLDSGRRLREFYLAKAIARGAELTVLSFGEGEQQYEDLSFCEMVTVPLPPRYTVGKLLQGILTETPLPVLNYSSEAMKQRLGDLLERRRFDIVQVESLAMTGYLPLVEKSVAVSRIVHDWHDIESDRMERFRRQTPSAGKRFYAKLTAGRLRRVETAILNSGAEHVVCSEHDRRRLAEFAPKANSSVVPNGVDVERFAGVGEGGERLLFVGAMNYEPNIQAVTEFARQVWPRLRARYARLRFTIVGSNPTPDVMSLGALERVEVTGTVPDVRPYYREAFAVVVPLRVGGGTRLKILEAMAAGVPVISTAIGAEGLDVEDGKNLLLAEEPEQWEAALEQLWKESGMREQLCKEGLSLVSEKYDWKAIGGRLLEFYREIHSGGPRQVMMQGKKSLP